MTLSLKAITKKFGGRTILHNLDLNVGDGECVALLGPSGCGKSTALRLIAGLDQPESGSISIDGTEMNNVPAEDRRVGMVFQSYALFPHLSVRENLELGLRMRGSHGAARDQRIKRFSSGLSSSRNWASRLLMGSSSKYTRGSRRSARAKATRCRCPPDNCAGLW